MKNVLIAGFEGDNNSAKVLLDKIHCDNKLYLENEFHTSEDQLKGELYNIDYDELIMFGQKPRIKKIYVETIASRNDLKYETNYAYNKLINYTRNIGYKAVISNNAGNYLCNNIFFYALDLQKRKFNDLKIIFIHIPTLNNICDIDSLANLFTHYLNN